MSINLIYNNKIIIYLHDTYPSIIMDNISKILILLTIR